MKLLIVVDRYAPEARSAAHLFEDLAKALAARGHEVSVLTKRPTENLPDGSGPVAVEEIRDGVRVTRFSSPFGEPRTSFLKAFDQFFFAVRVLVRLVWGPRYDVVLVYSPPLLLAGACALSGVRLVVNLHDIYPRTAVELGRLRSPILIAAAGVLEDFVYQRARHIIVPAPASMAYLMEEKGLSAVKVSLVYNWVDLDGASPGNGSAFLAEHGLEGKFVVTYAGLVGVAQDLSALISAARLAQDDANLAFLIIGEGSELKRWKAAGAGLANLRFLPTLPRAGYLDALRASQAGLIALSGELRSPAIPGKLQNLMALARPVLAIVPKGSAAAKTVAESGCGLTSEPGDGAALLRAIARLRADAGLRAGLGEAGRRFAEGNFALGRAVDAFEFTLSAAMVK